MKLYVDYSSNCYEHYTSPEQWGSWYSHSDPSIDGVHIRKSIGESFEVPFDVEVGDTVLVLYMVYSTGDSFGHSTGNLSIEWVFKDKQLAYDAYNKLVEAEKAEKYHFMVALEDGSEMTLYNPSHGYFEHMERIDLQSMRVEL